MSLPLPYCGTPPAPGELLSRFNFDPILIAALAGLALLHILLAKSRSARVYAVSGWTVAASALLSPLCALSVSLFSARVAQHMILLLIASPLIALGLPSRRAAPSKAGPWAGAALFFVALWVWHMPSPYAATFDSKSLYWLMHLTLFGSAIILWRTLLHHDRDITTSVLAVGIISSTQMGLLGAVLALASRPMFAPHFATAPLWGFTALQDQQLGGILMWVPGIALFLWSAIRSARRLWTTLDTVNRNESDAPRIS